MEKDKKRARDAGLDGLRAIGLLAIILAHVGTPEWLFQIRNFDVPLMVLISGAVFGLSEGAAKNYLSYFKSRVGRLLIPTWIFLTFFFSLVFLITKYLNQNFPYSLSAIITSFDLTDGAGYVWIIRVFILVAVALPILIKVCNKFPTIYLHILFWSYLLYEILNYSYTKTNFIQNMPILNYLVKYVVFYIVPYGIIAGLGFYLTKMKKRSILFLALLSGAIFAFLAISLSNPNFVPTQNFKYPPQTYYFSYALAISLALYLVSKTRIFQKIFGSKILMFISQSSLWIFLWQILYLYLWSQTKVSNFILEYIFVVLFSVLTTFFQKKLVRMIIGKIKNKQTVNFLNTAFLK